MVRPETVPMRVTLEFTYAANIYDGDPTDAFELAELEQGSLSVELSRVIEDLLGDVPTLSVKVQPE